MNQRPEQNGQSDDPERKRQGEMAPAAPVLGEARAAWAVGGFLLTAVFLVFGQTARHEFVNYDDGLYVYDNPVVARGLTTEGIGWAMTTNFLGMRHPLTWLSHMADCHFYGLNAGGHHLTSVLLHAANAVLLFLVLRRMTGDLWPAAFVAAAFAVHPLRVESVAWAAERKDVLSGLFFLLILLAYLGYVRRPSWVRYWGVALLFALGLMAKPMLVTLPFVLLLLDYWPLGRIKGGLRFLPDVGWAERSEPHQNRGKPQWWGTQKLDPPYTLRQLVVEKIPLFILAAVASVAMLPSQGESAENLIIVVPLWSRIANALVSYVAYLGQFFYPLGLAVLYPHPGTGLPIWQAAVALLALAALSLAALACWRRRPYVFVGWLWYVGMLVPVSGLVPVGGLHAMADHYTYLPEIGLCIAIGWGVADILRSWSRRRWILGVASAFFLALMVGCAWRQAAFWRDSKTLWHHALTCTSRNEVAHNNLGIALAGKGRFDEAIAHCREALKIKPDYALAHNNLGIALAGKGLVDEAIGHYREALKINPDFAVTHYNLGIALAGKGLVDEAIGHYRKALKINPDYAEAHSNLGSVLAGQGRVDEAIGHYRQALKIKPDYAEAHYNFGTALLGSGRVDEAIAHYREALKINPDYATAHNNLGSVLANKGRSDEAISQYRQALKIKPDYAEAHNNLGNALAAEGRCDEAVEHYQQALIIQPDFAEAHYNLGNLLLGKGRIDEAIAHYRDALKIKPNYAEAHYNLGNLLLGKGRIDEAIGHYRKALIIKPNYAEAHYNLGNLLLGKGRIDEAIGHYRKALIIKPNYAEAHENLGNVLAAEGRFDEAVEHYQQALKIKPNPGGALNGLAWLRATAPKASLRNGPEAIELAQRALRSASAEQASILDTLAAAYAEAGRWPEAVATARKALELAKNKQNQQPLAKAIGARLRLYELGQPYREMSKP